MAATTPTATKRRPPDDRAARRPIVSRSRGQHLVDGRGCAILFARGAGPPPAAWTTHGWRRARKAGGAGGRPDDGRRRPGRRRNCRRCGDNGRGGGPIAQRSEQGTHNPLVPGSSPGGPTISPAPKVCWYDNRAPGAVLHCAGPRAIYVVRRVERLVRARRCEAPAGFRGVEESMIKGESRMARRNAARKSNGGSLGFEAELFKAADKLRGNMEPSDYKHVVLGLIFLKYISDAFEARHQALLTEDPAAAEDRDEYLAENVFWVPKQARWSHLQANAKKPTIGTLIDDAMRAIEKENESLKGVLPKDYARPALNKVMLGELIDLISGIALNEEGGKSKDILGRVYEYFLGQFAGAEGKRGGEFYTPRSVVRVLVEMLEPYTGRVYDPCCGSGGMFVQSDKFVQEHGGRIGDIAIYGQESNYTTWRLCKMNLAVRGIDADIRWNNEGSFHKDELRDLKFDFILANPPFNVSDWGGER